MQFDDLPATTGLLLTTPNECLESYGKLGYEKFSVFSLPQLGSTHMAGFQLGVGTHRITRGENMESFYPRYFDFVCALPTLALGVAAAVDCVIRITPSGPGLEGRWTECTFTAGGLLSPLEPATCWLGDWGGSRVTEATTIEVVQPAVLNTLYAFGMTNFGYVDYIPPRWAW
ncbi:hypothetical protein KJ359_002533 [Pestalotiopsis sp. 9143b]|nr:hypothetical protein KJ359_002533 [Pestalotiopsis sp. 9143b]